MITSGVILTWEHDNDILCSAADERKARNGVFVFIEKRGQLVCSLGGKSGFTKFAGHQCLISFLQ